MCSGFQKYGWQFIKFFNWNLYHTVTKSCHRAMAVYILYFIPVWKKKTYRYWIQGKRSLCCNTLQSICNLKPLTLMRNRDQNLMGFNVFIKPAVLFFLTFLCFLPVSCWGRNDCNTMFLITNIEGLSHRCCNAILKG